MDNLFIEQFTSNYSAKLFAEGFVYKDKSVSEPKFFDRKFFSVLSIPNKNGDILYIEETAKENNSHSKSYELHFSFNTQDDEEKTARMLRYLDKIFNTNFNYMKAIHDSYVQAGLDVGLFIKTGDVEFKPSSILSHMDTSVVNKKFNVAIQNVTYNPVVAKIIKTKKIDLKGGIPQSFDDGEFTATFQTKVLFLDQSPFLFYNNGETPILVHSPNSSITEVLSVGMFYTYFYDSFKDRIGKKFLDMDIDLKTISKELFDSYIDVIDMSKI